MAKELPKKQEENGSRSATADSEALRLEQEDRRFQDALEDDDVREALELLHARGKERMRKRQEKESGSRSAKADRAAILQEDERQYQDALEDDDVREALEQLHGRNKTA